jgi:hypothetical protein
MTLALIDTTPRAYHAGAYSPSKGSWEYLIDVADSLPPVAIRVARPYATEDELLENELETLTRTSITLLGAQPLPQGLVLRFELLLSGGQAVVRGEGRVVGYKPDVYYGLGGLMLRFTRLDTRSKALIDRAAAMRERRRPSSASALGERPSLPSPAMRVDETPDAGPHEILSLPPQEPAGDPIPSPVPPAARTAAENSEPPSARFSADRDALLDRLRARSKALDGDVLRKILERAR